MKNFRFSVLFILITIVSHAQSPGGVNPGGALKFWVKADAGLTLSGTNVTGWTNQADVTKSMIVGGSPNPVLPAKTSYINFNPAVKLLKTGAASGSLFTTKPVVPANSNLSRFVVFNDTSANTGAANMLGSGAPPPYYLNGTIAFLKPGAANNVTQWVGGLNAYGNTGNFTQDIPQLGTAVSVLGAAPVNYIKINGVQNTVSSVNAGYSDANVQIGATYNLGGGANVNYFYGYIPEAIIYSTALSATEITKVESYLSVKYGTTLSGNYLASNGTVIWNSGGGYDNNIAGLGRDQQSALYQKQSMSQNRGNQVVVSVGNIAASNAENLNTISADKQFLIWGDNGKAAVLDTLTGLQSYVVRFKRIWKLQQTNNFSENIKIYFPVSKFTGIPASQIALIYGPSEESLSDGTGSVIVQNGTTVIGNIDYYSFDIPAQLLFNMQYFSFAANVDLPGGVPGASMWVRADINSTVYNDGDNVSKLDDHSGNGNDAVQADNNFKPVFKKVTASTINFNPVVNFDVPRVLTTADYLTTGNLGLPGQLNAALFGVGNIGWFINTIPAASGNQGTNSVEFAATNPNVGNARMHLAGGLPGDANGTTNYTVQGNVSIKTGWRTNGVFSAGVNSQVVATSPTGTTTPFTNFNLQIGRGFGLTIPIAYNGPIPEVIVFPKALSSFESQKVNSYLAIKYGISLSRDNDKDNNECENIAAGYNEGDYFASNDTRIWESSSSFGSNVAGIGRDDLSRLLQKQSRSIQNGAHIIMSRGQMDSTNALNANTFASDIQFLVWGDNNIPAGTFAFSDNQYTLRQNRVWRVQRTGTFAATDDVYVYIPQTYLNIAGYKVSLMYNATDYNFNAANQYISSEGIVSVNGTNYYTFVLPASILNAGNSFYMTLAGYLLAPGGVLGETVWLRADAQKYADGISLDATSKWIATTGNNAGQYEAQYTSGGVKPVFKKGIWNFNPVVRFNLGAIGADYLNTGDSITTFTALNNKGISGGQGPSPAGEVRILSMTGSTNADFSLGGLIPVLGGSPLRTMTNGTANIANFTANTLNGINPGIATSMRTPINSAAVGNTTSTLYAQWNGSAPVTTASSTRFNVDYYVLGGLAKGSQTIETDRSFFTGDIPEVIVYSNDLTSVQRQRINSYLSIKYGVTLDQITPQNYLASDGATVYWNASGTHATFKNNIAGIGKDNITGLFQKQGQSINAGDQVAISLGTIAATNADNGGTFNTDKQFLVWGDDAGSATTTTSVTGFGTVRLRMMRTWELQNTNGFNQQVTVYYPATALTTSFGNKLKYLIYDNNPGFNGTAKTAVAAGTNTTINGIAYTAFTVTFPVTGTLYFSFGMASAAPFLTIAGAVCTGNGTYDVSFNSNGIVTASAGTVTGNTVTGIPVGTNITLTAAIGSATTTAVVTSPASCPPSNGCTPPVISAGNGVCLNGTKYAVSFNVTPGATVSVNDGVISGNTITNITVGTNLTITATLGGCSSNVTVNSPADCTTGCTTPSASFNAGVCSGSTYTVSFVKTATSVLTASAGTVNNGGAGSTAGTISNITTGTTVTVTVTESGCSVQTITINVPSAIAPVLTTGNGVCSGTGTYSVAFNSNGIVSASAGTVSGNSVTGIPVGTNITLTSTSTNGCATTTAVVTSPASCPPANGCTPPAIAAGNGVCLNGTKYAVSFSVTPGATVAVNDGVISGNTITNITVGTNLTITATLGGCSSSVTVNSPADCTTGCTTPSASFNEGVCSGSTYTVSFVKTATSVLTASSGTVNNGGVGSTAGTISNIAAGATVTVTVTEPGCSAPAQIIYINAPSRVAPVLTTGNAVCSGTGTYSVTFNSNGIVTTNAGTVSGNTVINIPVGTNVTLTATSTNGCATTTAVVTSPANCPPANGCTPPAIAAGNGVCLNGTKYAVSFSVTPGATVSVNDGVISGNTITNITVGTNLTITATLGGCSSSVTVNSPSDCTTGCTTPSASFNAGVCSGSTYTVSFVKTATSVLTASSGTVNNGGAGSTAGTISNIAAGATVTVTVTEPGCSAPAQIIYINAPSRIAPVLTTGNAVCSGTGTYSVTFNSNGIVTTNAGTVSGNTVMNIPVGTNVTLTSTSSNGCATTTAVVTSPANCPPANGCTPPAIAAGNGVCLNGTKYAVSFSVTPGATVVVNDGVIFGNTITNITVGTNLTITATLGGCSSSVTVNSPADCTTGCTTPSASFNAGVCSGSTYTVSFVKTATSVLTASSGTVNNGGVGSTAGSISNISNGTTVTVILTEPGCNAPPQLITINPPSITAPLLTTGSGVCSGAGTYSVVFNSNGFVTTNAGTVYGNTVINIPAGTNVTLTATSVNGCATTSAMVTAPANCPVSNLCTPPALSAGNGVCSGGGFYSVAFSADPGSSVSTSSGIINGNSIANIPLGTNVTITATAAIGNCSTVLQVNSPSDCSTMCNTAAASFSLAQSNGVTYSVKFTKRSNAVITATAGIVNNGGTGNTSGTITGIPVGTNIIATITEAGCSTTAYLINSPRLGVVVNAKVFLQGAMAGSSMTIRLRTTINPANGLPLVPLSQPYGVAPWNYPGAESVGSSASLPGNLTDWVLVELRDASSPSTVIAARAAFLLSGGEIVDLDGVSPVAFPAIGEGTYYVAIRHRNHLGIRTAAPQYLHSASLLYDFTTAQASAYQNPIILSNGGLNNGNAALRNLGNGLFAMWGGNANSNNNVRYSGPSNDQSAILNGVLGGNASNILINVYINGDLNLNGAVNFSGPGNDQNFLLNIVLGGIQDLIISQHL